MDNRDSRKLSLVLVILMCSSSVIIGTVLILVFTTGETNSLGLNLTLRILGPFVTAAIFALVGAIAYHQEQRDEEVTHNPKYDDLILADEKTDGADRIIKKALEPSVFQGDREKQVCEICKKEIKDGHIVIECPRCASLFHHDHILEWLEKDPLCPVCKEDL